MSQGYYSHPTLHGERLVFVCEEDLWEVPLQGGVARRLSHGRGAFVNAHFSPDGQWLAVTASEDGPQEVFLMPSHGGPLTRLSYLNFFSAARGWHKSEVLVSTWALNPHWCDELATIPRTGGGLKRLELGHALRLATSTEGDEVVERNGWRPDSSHWKGYRGGTAGKFYRRQHGKKEFTPFLRQLDGNLTHPLYHGETFLFCSDHQGIANIYQSDAAGKKVRALTHEQDYYVRNPSLHGDHLVYQCAGRLKHLDLRSGVSREIPIEVHSTRTATRPRWQNALPALEDIALSASGKSLVLTARGQALAAEAFQGPVLAPSLPLEQRHRDRLAQFVSDTPERQEIVFVTDEKGLTESESLVLVNLAAPGERKLLKSAIGRVSQLKVSPQGDHVALTNHRNELLVVNLKSDKSQTVLAENLEAFTSFDWSPDGQWIVTHRTLRHNHSEVVAWNLASKKLSVLTRPLTRVESTHFSPCGQYVTFLGHTHFDARYENNHRFQLFFQHSARPFVILLTESTPSPLRPLKAQGPSKSEEGKEKAAGPATTKIELDNIFQRVVEIPADTQEYRAVIATSKGLLLAHAPIPGTKQGGGLISTGPSLSLDHFDFAARKQKTLARQVNRFTLSPSREHMLLEQNGQLLLKKTLDFSAEQKVEGPPSEASGLIDTQRFQISLHPANEWQQIFHETWRLMKLYFWEKNIGGVDWEKMRRRYHAVFPRIATRSELSDLMWELIGEVRVGHAYVGGGDLRFAPPYRLTSLGAEVKWDARAAGYRISKILRGSPFCAGEQSPLALGDVQLSEGDVILAVNRQAVSEKKALEAMLTLPAGLEVELTVKRKNQKAETRVSVKTLENDRNLRYRHWVEENRRQVHTLSKGKLGYVHIPDMGPDGYTEFFEQYAQEFDYDGLIVDVRYNGGGHVSQLILSKLAQKRVGMDLTRWMGHQPYPGDAPAGVVLALTNEYAGSDGDIFSHCFKLMKIGTLMGTRTWGGVIGIWPRHRLMDGGYCTQPEFAFWFKDVGWNVENYGTMPDIVVDNLPHHFEQGVDQQLKLAITQTLKELKSKPAFRPKLPAPPIRA